MPLLSDKELLFLASGNQYLLCLQLWDKLETSRVARGSFLFLAIL